MDIFLCAVIHFSCTGMSLKALAIESEKKREMKGRGEEVSVVPVSAEGGAESVVDLGDDPKHWSCEHGKQSDSTPYSRPL